MEKSKVAYDVGGGDDVVGIDVVEGGTEVGP